MKFNIRTILLALLAAAAILAAATLTPVDDQIVETSTKLVDTFFPATPSVVDTSSTIIVSDTAVIAD